MPFSSQRMTGAHVGEHPASCTACGRMLDDDSTPGSLETLTKTRQSDDTVSLDHPQFTWLCKILRELGRLPKTETLVETDCPRVQDMMNEACLWPWELLEVLEPARTEVKKRGRYSSLWLVRKGRPTQRQLADAHWTLAGSRHSVTALASLLTDHRTSGFPIRARYKPFNRICEQTCDNSPTDSSSSCLN